MQEIHHKKVRVRDFVKEMLPLAVPVALHEFLTSMVNIVDTIMVGRINETAIAAVNLANQFFFIFILMMVGICSGSAIFVAQYFGDKDVKGIQRTIGLTLIVTVISSVAFAITAVIFAEPIISFFSPDPAVVELGTVYLKITGYTFPLVGLSFSYGWFLRTMHKAKIPLVVSVFGLTTNTTLNFIFIFGKFGFPAMGVEGAALATLFARLLELSLLFAIMRVKNSIALAPVKNLFAFPRGFVKKVVLTNYPVLLNEMGWVLGTVLFNKIYASISTQGFTSFCVANTIFNIFFVIFFGTSSATGILIGNKIGENNLSLAHVYARIVHKLIPAISVVLGIILACGSGVMPKVYGLDGETLRVATLIILIYAVILPFRTFNLHTVNGILRSGGDTKFGLAMDIGGVWLIGLPMALFAKNVLGLPLTGVLMFALSEEIIKTIVGFWRVKSGKWINRVIE
ncbi:MAG: MATE family efflux transporter [Chitinivibrionia bacterium]|nr:MATE family efflux transporter [Chitinivibrionia bacterium]